jgi:tetratricopeptide (TPR) repeat protein
LHKITAARWPSAFVAAAFALHPLHVESVAWVAERKDVLSTLFGLVTIAAYVRYIKGPTMIRYLLMLIAYALCLMAKAMLVTLPFILLLLDYWPLGLFQIRKAVKTNRKKQKSTRVFSRWGSFYYLVREKIPLFVFSIASCIVTMFAEESTVARIDLLPLGVRIINAFTSYSKYIARMFWPSNLGVFYPDREAGLAIWQLMMSAILILAVFILVVRMAPRRPYLLTGWLWYIVTLIPVIGLVQVGAQALADRYTYLPSVGIFIMVAWAVKEFSSKWSYRKVVLIVCSFAVLSAFSICTWFQLHHWRNSLTLFQRALNVTTNNTKMHSNLAIELQLHGRTDEAIVHFREAVRIKPDYVNALNNLGKALQSQGKVNEAITYYQRVLSLRPGHPDALSNLGGAFQKLGKNDEAISYLRRALDSNPGHLEAHNNIGLILQSQRKFDKAVSHFHEALNLNPYYAEARNNLGITLAMQKKMDEAIEQLRRAIAINPNYAEAHYNLANALRFTDKLDEAVRHFRQALSIKADFVEAHYSLAKTLESQAKYDEAMTHYRYAMEANPAWPGPLNGLASILATHPDPKRRDAAEAIELARRAAKLTQYKDPTILDTLAAAYAAAGQFKEAIVFGQLALKGASAAENKQLADDIQKRLQAYEQWKSTKK